MTEKLAGDECLNSTAHAARSWRRRNESNDGVPFVRAAPYDLCQRLSYPMPSFLVLLPKRQPPRGMGSVEGRDRIDMPKRWLHVFAFQVEMRVEEEA